MIFQQRKRPSIIDQNSNREQFLANEYLNHAYLVPEDIKILLEKTADVLSAEQPNFIAIVNVGGTANGSLALRRAIQQSPKRITTDIDFYFIAQAPTELQLEKMAKIAREHITLLGYRMDGVLNGTRREHLLDLNALPRHLTNQDFNLLSLPFQSAFGNVAKAQQAVVDAVRQCESPQEIWDHIAEAHIESLSLHHRTFDIPFAQHILDDYFEKKIRKFQLPDSPADFHIQISPEPSFQREVNIT